MFSFSVSPRDLEGSSAYHYPTTAGTPRDLEGEGSTNASFVLFLLSRRVLRALLQEIPGLCQQPACEYWREVAAFQIPVEKFKAGVVVVTDSQRDS